MFRLYVYLAFCAFATCVNAQAPASLKYGMTMSTRSYDAICWFENLKNFPDTYSQNYGQCSEAASNIQNQIENPSEQNKQYFAYYPDKQVTTYGDWMTSMAMPRIPGDYQAACDTFLKDPYGNAAQNEADALNDGSTSNYPYKAFAYCLMSHLRNKKGNGAIDAVKSERTHTLKAWQLTMLDRENEFRARHGSESFRLNKQLTEEAQKWAETNAKACSMYHSHYTDSGRQFDGKPTGESLASYSASNNNSQVAAYIAVDSWYEENKEYPWPEYKGAINDPMFKRIGHFTQSVWKDSKLVGYGYAFNPGCTYKSYIAARYYPSGNWVGEFGKNVFLPK